MGNKSLHTGYPLSSSNKSPDKLNPWFITGRPSNLRKLGFTEGSVFILFPLENFGYEVTQKKIKISPKLSSYNIAKKLYNRCIRIRVHL
jgi:hypothetical protein